MIDKKSWTEFKDCGLLWYINTFLHMFGWAIVTNIENGEITEVYPARVKFRGFSEESNTNGYKKVSKYMKDNADQLFTEASDED